MRMQRGYDVYKNCMISPIQPYKLFARLPNMHSDRLSRMLRSKFCSDNLECFGGLVERLPQQWQQWHSKIGHCTFSNKDK